VRLGRGGWREKKVGPVTFVGHDNWTKKKQTHARKGSKGWRKTVDRAFPGGYKRGESGGGRKRKAILERQRVFIKKHLAKSPASSEKGSLLSKNKQGGGGGREKEENKLELEKKLVLKERTLKKKKKRTRRKEWKTGRGDQTHHNKTFQ